MIGVYMSIQNKALKAARAFFAALPLLLPSGAALAAARDFPVYPCIKANVAFWEDIYSRYTTSQAVLHDSGDLSRVYGVVQLLDRGAPGATRLNEARTKLAKERIAAALDRLAAGHAPRTDEERRIARMFAGKSAAAYARAKENLRSQLGQKDSFEAGVIRSGRYLPYIRQVLAARGLPAELAYLPHVESSFNPRAGSKAGAYGLWQFTRGTGQDYLTINSLVDERFDPFASSRAAAQFLQENYEVLGTWPLALTAYNYGRAGMQRALETHGSYEAIFQDYAQGYFKFASRNFYSEFLAAVRVAQRLEKTLEMETPMWVRGYRLTEETSIEGLCAKHKLSREDFVRLNPALQAPVLEGKRKAPVNYLVRLPGVAGLQTPAKQTVAAAREPAVTERPTTTVVPAARRAPPVRQGLGNMGSMTESSVHAGVMSAPRIEYFHYTVVPGDTLSGIAARFGASKEHILRANGKGPDNPVRVGDRLRIPTRRL